MPNPILFDIATKSGLPIGEVEERMEMAKRITSEDFGVPIDEFGPREMKHSQEILMTLTGLNESEKKNRFNEFLSSKKRARQFIESTVMGHKNVVVVFKDNKGWNIEQEYFDEEDANRAIKNYLKDRSDGGQAYIRFDESRIKEAKYDTYYNVIGRRDGKWVNFNKEPLSKSEAIALKNEVEAATIPSVEVGSVYIQEIVVGLKMPESKLKESKELDNLKKIISDTKFKKDLKNQKSLKFSWATTYGAKGTEMYGGFSEVKIGSLLSDIFEKDDEETNNYLEANKLSIGIDDYDNEASLNLEESRIKESNVNTGYYIIENTPDASEDGLLEGPFKTRAEAEHLKNSDYQAYHHTHVEYVNFDNMNESKLKEEMSNEDEEEHYTNLGYSDGYSGKPYSTTAFANSGIQMLYAKGYKAGRLDREEIASRKFFTESQLKEDEIQNRLDQLQKMSKKDLLDKYSQSHKVNSAEIESKDVIISEILEDEFVRKALEKWNAGINEDAQVSTSLGNISTSPTGINKSKDLEIKEDRKSIIPGMVLGYTPEDFPKGTKVELTYTMEDYIVDNAFIDNDGKVLVKVVGQNKPIDAEYLIIRESTGINKDKNLEIKEESELNKLFGDKKCPKCGSQSLRFINNEWEHSGKCIDCGFEGEQKDFKKNEAIDGKKKVTLERIIKEQSKQIEDASEEDKKRLQSNIDEAKRQLEAIDGNVMSQTDVPYRKGGEKVEEAEKFGTATCIKDTTDKLCKVGDIVSVVGHDNYGDIMIDVPVGSDANRLVHYNSSAFSKYFKMNESFYSKETQQVLESVLKEGSKAEEFRKMISSYREEMNDLEREKSLLNKNAPDYWDKERDISEKMNDLYQSISDINLALQDMDESTLEESPKYSKADLEFLMKRNAEVDNARNLKVGDWIWPYNTYRGTKAVKVTKVEGDLVYSSDGESQHYTRVRTATPNAIREAWGLPKWKVGDKIVSLKRNWSLGGVGEVIALDPSRKELIAKFPNGEKVRYAIGDTSIAYVDEKGEEHQFIWEKVNESISGDKRKEIENKLELYQTQAMTFNEALLKLAIEYGVSFSEMVDFLDGSGKYNESLKEGKLSNKQIQKIKDITQALSHKKLDDVMEDIPDDWFGSKGENYKEIKDIVDGELSRMALGESSLKENFKEELRKVNATKEYKQGYADFYDSLNTGASMTLPNNKDYVEGWQEADEENDNEIDEDTTPPVKPSDFKQDPPRGEEDADKTIEEVAKWMKENKLLKEDYKLVNMIAYNPSVFNKDTQNGSYWIADNGVVYYHNTTSLYGDSSEGTEADFREKHKNNPRVVFLKESRNLKEDELGTKLSSKDLRVGMSVGWFLDKENIVSSTVEEILPNNEVKLSTYSTVAHKKVPNIVSIDELRKGYNKSYF